MAENTQAPRGQGGGNRGGSGQRGGQGGNRGGGNRGGSADDKDKRRRGGAAASGDAPDAGAEPRGEGRGKGKRDDKRERREREEERQELDERVIDISRVAKVIKGGRRFAFRTVVIVGDNKGSVGIGVGKSRGVPDSIRKGSERAKRQMHKVALAGSTIPHEVTAQYGGARVMLRPASPGTGVIAGGGVRAVLEAVGVRDILTKSQGSNNLLNVAMATVRALEQLVSAEDLAKMRGKSVDEMRPFWEQAARRLGKRPEEM